MLKNLKRIIIIAGHYGCGKTNFAVNLALWLEKSGERVTLIDMDIVNPYFRTADFKELFNEKRINLIIPNFANTLLDIPSLPREVDGAIESGERLIIDLGGDDAGATVLGRYAREIAENGGASMLYLFSKYRPFTESACDVKAHIAEIEAVAGLKVTALVNSSNLGVKTTAEDIKSSLEYSEETQRLTGLPVLATLVSDRIEEQISVNNTFPVRLYVLPPWEAVK